MPRRYALSQRGAHRGAVRRGRREHRSGRALALATQGCSLASIENCCRRLWQRAAARRGPDGQVAQAVLPERLPAGWRWLSTRGPGSALARYASPQSQRAMTAGRNARPAVEDVLVPLSRTRNPCMARSPSPCARRAARTSRAVWPRWWWRHETGLLTPGSRSTRTNRAGG